MLQMFVESAGYTKDVSNGGEVALLLDDLQLAKNLGAHPRENYARKYLPNLRYSLGSL